LSNKWGGFSQEDRKKYEKMAKDADDAYGAGNAKPLAALNSCQPHRPRLPVLADGVAGHVGIPSDAMVQMSLFMAPQDALQRADQERIRRKREQRAMRDAEVQARRRCDDAEKELLANAEAAMPGIMSPNPILGELQMSAPSWNVAAAVVQGDFTHFRARFENWKDTVNKITSLHVRGTTDNFYLTI